MRRNALALASVIGGLCAAPVHAQAPTGLTGDLLKATNEVEGKLVGLANAMSEAQYGWRPAEGVRSVGEVFLLHEHLGQMIAYARVNGVKPPWTR